MIWKKRESFWIIKFKINRELTIYLNLYGWMGWKNACNGWKKTSKNIKKCDSIL